MSVSCGALSSSMCSSDSEVLSSTVFFTPRHGICWRQVLTRFRCCMFQRFCIFALMGAQRANRDHERIWDMSTTVPPVDVQPEAAGEALWCRDQVWRNLVSVFLIIVDIQVEFGTSWTRRLQMDEAPSQLYRSRSAEVRDDTEKACADQPRSHAAALRPRTTGKFSARILTLIILNGASAT